MNEPIAYLNREILPAHATTVSVLDPGFLLGVTVAEQLRTFGGKLFRLDEHLQRLERSLAIVGVDSGHSRDELVDIAERVVTHNHALVADGDDVGLVIFVTPGVGEPTVCLHTRRITFEQWAAKYEHGEALATTSIEQVSSQCWPPELKCRSRMHYYLADREAQQKFPGSRALMCDADGFATEATTANVLVYRKSEGLISPPSAKILPGISVAVLKELANKLGISHREADLRVEDFAAADEVLLCSTSPCVLPVTRLNGKSIADGKPGDVFRKLLSEWSKLVGLDIAAQAKRFTSRPAVV